MNGMRSFVASAVRAITLVAFILAPDAASGQDERDVREPLVDVAAPAPSVRAGTRVAETIAARLLDVHGVLPQEVRIPPLLDLEALASEAGTKIVVDVAPRAGASASLPVSVAILRGRVLQRVAVTARVVISARYGSPRAH